MEEAEKNPSSKGVIDHGPLPNEEGGPWAPAKEDWIWGDSWGGIQGSAAPCLLYQVRIQPSNYDNVPPLEALVRVPRVHSEGLITHRWSIQMVSGPRGGKGTQVCEGELLMGNEGREMGRDGSGLIEPAKNQAGVNWETRWYLRGGEE